MSAEQLSSPLNCIGGQNGYFASHCLEQCIWHPFIERGQTKQIALFEECEGAVHLSVKKNAVGDIDDAGVAGDWFFCVPAVCLQPF